MKKSKHQLNNIRKVEISFLMPCKRKTAPWASVRMTPIRPSSITQIKRLRELDRQVLTLHSKMRKISLILSISLSKRDHYPTVTRSFPSRRQQVKRLYRQRTSQNLLRRPVIQTPRVFSLQILMKLEPLWRTLTKGLPKKLSRTRMSQKAKMRLPKTPVAISQRMHSKRVRIAPSNKARIRSPST